MRCPTLVRDGDDTLSFHTNLNATHTGQPAATPTSAGAPHPDTDRAVAPQHRTGCHNAAEPWWAGRNS